MRRVPATCGTALLIDIDAVYPDRLRRNVRLGLSAQPDVHESSFGIDQTRLSHEESAAAMHPLEPTSASSRRPSIESHG